MINNLIQSVVLIVMIVIGYRLKTYGVESPVDFYAGKVDRECCINTGLIIRKVIYKLSVFPHLQPVLPVYMNTSVEENTYRTV